MHLRRALDLSPNHVGARGLLALRLVQDTATVREGAQLAQQAALKAPEDHRAHLAMAILGLRQGNWQMGAAARRAIVESTVLVQKHSLASGNALLASENALRWDVYV